MANISIYDPRTMGKLVERMPKVQTFIKSTFSEMSKHSTHRRLM